MLPRIARTMSFGYDGDGELRETEPVVLQWFRLLAAGAAPTVGAKVVIPVDDRCLGRCRLQPCAANRAAMGSMSCGEPGGGR